jgi:hypothetical protein
MPAPVRATPAFGAPATSIVGKSISTGDIKIVVGRAPVCPLKILGLGFHIGGLKTLVLKKYLT